MTFADINLCNVQLQCCCSFFPFSPGVECRRKPQQHALPLFSPTPNTRSANPGIDGWLPIVHLPVRTTRLCRVEPGGLFPPNKQNLPNKTKLWISHVPAPSLGFETMFCADRVSVNEFPSISLFDQFSE